PGILKGIGAMSSSFLFENKKALGNREICFKL
ncbi:unnamed protein product, partial [marine sediment metagenome]